MRATTRCIPVATLRSFACVFLVTATLACAGGMERVQSPDRRLVALSCYRFNPAMQTAILEAVVAGGGPSSVDVAGWMCGKPAFGTVRIVMLRYTPDDPRAAPFLIPVVFEAGSLVAFGWHLLEAQPERYATERMPDREHPWRAPEGWSCLRDPVFATPPA